MHQQAIGTDTEHLKGLLPGLCDTLILYVWTGWAQKQAASITENTENFITGGMLWAHT